MKLLEPRRKRRVTAVPRPPFPIQIESETGIPASRALWQVYTGIFNGDCVVVDEPHEMDIIFNMGFFGKGSLSRGGPEYGKVKKGLPPYLRNRQWLRRKEWAEEQEKIEREAAATSVCVTKDQTLEGDEDTDKYVVECENHVKESAAPEKSDYDGITSGPSGNSLQSTEGSGRKDSLQNVIVLEASDVSNAKTGLEAALVSNVAVASLKETDVVVLSDDEAPKRLSKSFNFQDEIEVIDDNSSNDDISNLKIHMANEESDAEIAIEKDLHEVRKVSSAACEPQAKRPRVGPTEDVIEIVDTAMDIDAPATIDSRENKVKEIQHRLNNEGGSCTADVVMLNDNDSSSGAGVVTVEDTDNSSSAGMIVNQKKDKANGDALEDVDLDERCKRTAVSSVGCKVLVLPDSDSEDEGYRNYVKNLTARLEWEQFLVRETLHLSLEEAYFLSYGLGCLQVLDPFGNVLSLVDLWKMFRDAQKDFVPKYVAYHYLRAKGWIVRSGLKYGGDFMLYKQGPVFYHASYVVVVEVLQADDWSRHPTLNSRSFSWASMTTLNRVVSAVGKELLICQVIWPTGVPSTGPESPASFPQFTVNEVLMRRWVASEEREKDEESVNWDSQ